MLGPAQVILVSALSPMFDLLTLEGTLTLGL